MAFSLGYAFAATEVMKHQSWFPYFALQLVMGILVLEKGPAEDGRFTLDMRNVMTARGKW